MIRALFFLTILGVGFFGFWMGTAPSRRNEEAIKHLHPERNFPVVENKSFALVVVAYNQESWCERALLSIFEQEYDHYRVIFIDDGSTDHTFEKARSFIVENSQDQKVIMIRNESRLGVPACLYRAMETMLDREIVIPMEGKDWLSHPMVLAKINGAYQNPDVWMTRSGCIAYPSYEPRADGHCTFYSGLFKQIRLYDLFREGKFTQSEESVLSAVAEMSGGRIRLFPEPHTFANEAAPSTPLRFAIERSLYPPLAEFPKIDKEEKKADLLLFSYNRPLQLYACLESIHRYLTGFERATVLYRVDNEEYATAYETVKTAFPGVQFIQQGKVPKKDFKPNVLKILFDSPSEYILFGVDDIIVKDFANLKECMEMMEKTGAYGFYLRFGKHITESFMGGANSQEMPLSAPLSSGVYAWDVNCAEADWGFPNNLDFTLYRKKDLQKAFQEMRFKTPNSLEFVWANEYKPKLAIGLFYELSKMVNIPLNIVSNTGNAHMNCFSPEELLVKFNEGLKMDIEPLFQIENSSPHLEYIPEFIPLIDGL